MQELNGKVAVITGGGSGIGRALAHRFAAEGMRIVLADRDEVKMRSVEAELGERGTEVLPVMVDTSVEADLQRLAEVVVQRFGGAHVLCNNAGVVGKGDAWQSPMSTWEWVIGINLYGVIHGIRAFLPIMEAQGEGHIVNTASMAGLVAVPGAAPYNVAKTGVVALSEGLYLELLSTGSPVRVSALCPGFVKTPLLHDQQWTDRLGVAPAAAVTPMGQLMESFFRDGLDNGIDADDVAAQVVDAIRAERFWILTHPEMRRAPVERMLRAEAQENPPVLSADG
jgi:NAD(P)-dependent dehydrogenase (short-subunit alcohol dehydrogenase family)